MDEPLLETHETRSEMTLKTLFVGGAPEGKEATVQRSRQEWPERCSQIMRI